MRHRIIIETDNNTSIVVRVLQIFTRRRIDVENLEVHTIEFTQRQFVNIIVCLSDSLIQKLIPQLQKQVDVFNATYTTIK